MALTKEAVKMLRKVKRHILAEPKRLYMSDWILRDRGNGKIYLMSGKERKFAKCGTAACIAGWTVILADREGEGRVGDTAKEILGLNDSQHDRLFAPSCWPEKFHQGTTGDGKKRTAEIAAKRIEHFIKTDGEE